MLFDARAADATEQKLGGRFTRDVQPFLQKYCLDCHDSDVKKAELDLSPYQSLESVVNDPGHWELVLERVQNGDMPPKKSKTQPSEDERRSVISWIENVRRHEAMKNAGDPGPVPARRLSNAEYDNTIRDLTGVDIRPTRTFPVDPANQAGFDNSAESLATSPALVKKYLDAAREVANHMVLTPDGLVFAPHPVVADTDRDKWGVFRIVEFYKRQPTDYAAYFHAAWQFKHRKALGMRNATIAEVAARAKVSPKYLETIWSTLNDSKHVVGPIARLQSMWNGLPAPGAQDELVTAQCGAMRDYVLHVRGSIVPEVKNLSAPRVQSGSQTLVMWKNRQMAANRRNFDPGALQVEGSSTNMPVIETVAAKPASAPAATNTNTPAYAGRGRTNRVQAPTPSIVQKGGFALPPAVLTTNSSATAKMAAMKKRGADPELIVPADPAERARYEAAFAQFADLFPDAFYITERARVYLDAEKEQENAGRLLSAGLHSMTGYFRDDQPLYDLILDETGQKELDRLWNEFEMVSSVPHRMHTSFVWFERTDSAYMRDPEFDAFRPEDKSVNTPEKIRALSEFYLAKAIRSGASDVAQAAIREHFEIVEQNVTRIDKLRASAETHHLGELERFAAKAYRRPLSDAEKSDIRAFYQASRQENGVDHEEAVRDCVVRILMSPHFSFRMDLVEAAGSAAQQRSSAKASHQRQPLSDYSLASRLSYFLWASMPDDRLLQLAESGKLRQSKVLRSEVRRMLQDPRVRNLAVEFGGNWLDFRRFEQHNSVDRERFPSFNNELRQAMFEEPIRLIMDVAQRDSSTLDFLYGDYTFLNHALAQHYGIPAASASSNDWVRVENASAFGRGGLLPMSVFLTANSPGLRTSPVKRGYWVARRVLGERIPPPPAIVPELPKDEKAMGERTLREALEEHRTREGCAECHARFDSLGLVFEAYGPVGERRDLDLGGRPVDTRADFPNGSKGTGLAGLVEYVRSEREDDFLDNLTRKLLAYGLGRTLILSDEPLVEEMRKKLNRDQYRFSSLVESIVTSEQFLNKRDGKALARN